MRIAVIGGTGNIGRLTVDRLRDGGHEPVVVARSVGIDALSGEGLDEAMKGTDAVIDVTNAPSVQADEARAFFGAVTRNVLAAEEAADVRHHVALSIVGLDRIEGNGHYVGKREQERLIATGPVPFTIVRATQFFDFPEMIVGLTRQGDTAYLPPLLVQPIAPADVAAQLVEVATNPAHDDTIEIAGPDVEDFVDMARRTLAAHGESVRLVPTWRGMFGVEAAGELLLPGPNARIGPTSFDAWLDTLVPAHA